MRDFFKGWRRKAGCATLLMACVFVAIWMRSFTAIDHFHLEFDESRFEAVSHDGLFSIDWRELRIHSPGQPPPIHWTSAVSSKSVVGHYPQVFHYSYVAIPLAFLSAWLLLSKPQPAKPIIPPAP